MSRVVLVNEMNEASRRDTHTGADQRCRHFKRTRIEASPSYQEARAPRLAGVLLPESLELWWLA